MPNDTTSNLQRMEAIDTSAEGDPSSSVEHAPTTPPADEAILSLAECEITPENMYFDVLERLHARLSGSDPQENPDFVRGTLPAQVLQTSALMALACVYVEAAHRTHLGDLDEDWAALVEDPNHRLYIQQAVALYGLVGPAQYETQRWQSNTAVN